MPTFTVAVASFTPLILVKSCLMDNRPFVPFFLWQFKLVQDFCHNLVTISKRIIFFVTTLCGGDDRITAAADRPFECFCQQVWMAHRMSVWLTRTLFNKGKLVMIHQRTLDTTQLIRLGSEWVRLLTECIVFGDELVVFRSGGGYFRGGIFITSAIPAVVFYYIGEEWKGNADAYTVC